MSNFESALTKCFYCGGDNYIMINKILTSEAVNNVKKCHGKVVDQTPCSECEEKFNNGYIALIEISNKEYKEKIKPEDAYRTGRILYIKKEICSKIFNVEIKTLILYIDVEVYDRLTEMFKSKDQQ